MPNAAATIRPLGLAWLPLPRPRPADAPRATAPAPGDALRLSPRPLGHGRFAAHPELAALAAPGAAPIPAGTSSAAIAAVQQALMDLGFAIPAHVADVAGATGTLGGQTRTALGNLQVAVGLPRTGRLDGPTMAALDRLAPPAGKKAWDPGVDPGPVPNPRVPGLGTARVVVAIGQHRVFRFDKAGKLQKIYSARSGKDGMDTMPGLKQVNGKIKDPTDLANRLWPESAGKAFGTRLLGLNDVDPRTGRVYQGPNAGQELHGTYQDASIGRGFSHGCVGLRNRDIEAIFAALPTGAYVRFDP